MVAFSLTSAAVAVSFAAAASAQTFQRLGTCPTLGCILPPDAQDFLAGQYFDIRVEIHAPVNGSEATDGKNPHYKQSDLRPYLRPQQASLTRTSL